MTQRLILMRHAKSSWKITSDDHARLLNDRGRESAEALGHWLRERGYLPDLILCSSAARTRETLERTGIEAETAFLRSLYLAPASAMLSALREHGRGTVMMLGHNFGIGELAGEIVADAPDHPRFADYPTGATLICDLPVNDWADAVSRSAHVVDFIVPRDLTNEISARGSG